MTEPRKLRVFLCHASQDKPVVRELYQRLLAEGWIDPWLDEEKLLPGQDWDIEIEKAVESADAVIVCLSNHSVTKEGYVQKELRSVLDVAEYKPEGAIFIIPILLEPCQLPRRLKNYQYQDYFTNVTLAYGRLVSSFETRAHTVGIDFIKIKENIRREDQEKLKREKEEQIRKEAEERVRREEENIIRQNAEEKARKALERKLRKEANEKVRQERERQERKEAEERTRLAEEEIVRKVREDKERKEAEEIARQRTKELNWEINNAIQLESNGKLEEALDEYYQIKTIDPTFPTIDEKITEVEKKIYSRKEKANQKIKEQEQREDEERVRPNAEELPRQNDALRPTSLGRSTNSINKKEVNKSSKTSNHNQDSKLNNPWVSGFILIVITMILLFAPLLPWLGAALFSAWLIDNILHLSSPTILEIIGVLW